MNKLLLLVLIYTSTFESAQPRKYTADELRKLRTAHDDTKPKFNPTKKKTKGLKITVSPPNNTPNMSPVDIQVVGDDIVVTFHEKKK